MATKYSTTDVVKAKTADELAAQYGVVNKQADILKNLTAATDAKFGMWDTQMKGIRDQQLTDYAAQFGQYQDYARKNRQNALRSGLSRGSAVAQEVMSQVQNQAYGAQNQTAYQQQLADIAAQKGAQVGADQFNSLNMANEVNMGLGGLANQQQQTETAGQTGYLEYLAGLAQANATKYSADKSVDASAAYGGAQSRQSYDTALAILGDDKAAWRVAYEGASLDSELKKKDYDVNGFPKNAAEGASFAKPNGQMYKRVNGTWQLQPGAETDTGGTKPWNWAAITGGK